MRSTILPFAVVLAAAIPAGARAVASDVAGVLAAIDARQKACIDKDPSNLGMKQCAGDADADADKLLNETYGAAVAALKRPQDGGDRDGGDARETLRRLVASERAWIAYRDAECAFEGTSMLGGTGEELVIVECHTMMTVARVKAIGSVLDAK